MNIFKSALIVIRERKMLVTSESGVGFFKLPGGKREGRENYEQALIREVREELGVDIIPETIKFYGSFKAQAHGKPLGTVVRAKCYTADFAGKLKASGEVEKLVWVTSKCTKNMTPIGQLVQSDLKSKGLID
jgi:8-oxo-dGTP diphosphatase